MTSELLRLMAARRGHFSLESGHHGELWLDVDRLFVRPERLRPHVEALGDRLASYGVDAVCGPLTGGAFLAQMVADRLGVDFVYAARVENDSAKGLYPVEYPIPAELAEFVRGRRVAVVNDVINAGSAVRGAFASLRGLQSHPIVLASLLVLGSAASQLAAREAVPFVALAEVENRIWTPDDCPYCGANVPLTTPVS